ncbi:MAG: peptidase M50 [Sulfobacillus benefaciens]|uniref:Peptidase M50 n=1 Tax=Sulfobacillus benefaciens TaxID=453960 RepID=A0A2T2XJ58_9FIRM|nr:MAG: peptidase M50 [Sulfobacillus benefaciens]
MGPGSSLWWRRITINPGFLVLVLVYIATGHGMTMAIAFIVVTCHELAHVIVAEAYGLTVSRMEIWPFGGMAEIPGLNSQEPSVETMVSVAGPLQNLLLAVIAWWAARWIPLDPKWVHEFIEANLFIGGLNLLPVSPLDGGHLVKAYWAQKLGYSLAEERIVSWGMWLALGLLALTVGSFLVGHPAVNMGLFAGFLYWGAWKSSHQSPYLIIRDLSLRPQYFAKRPVWLIEDFAVRFDAPIADVLKIMRPLKYHRLLVLDADLKRMGTLYEEQLLQAVKTLGPKTPVGDLLLTR